MPRQHGNIGPQRFVGAVAALAGLSMGATAAGGQEVADTFALSELVVTATRLPAPRAVVPAAVTVLEGAELRARGVHFLADALRDVAGASLVRTGSVGGLTALFLRGGESDYVQVMVDGVALNDPGGAFDLGQMTLDDVERIEVVRGPVSVLYGSDAVTGVVHVITRSGDGPTRVSAGAEMGTAGRRPSDLSLCPGACPGTADLDRYITRRFNVGVAGSAGPARYALGVSDYRSDGAYPFNNAYDNRTVSGRLHFGDGEGGASVTARHADGLYRYPTDGSGQLVDTNAYRSSGSLALGLDAGRWWGERIETRLALSYRDGAYETVDEPDEEGDTLGFFASRNESHVDRRKADLRVNLYASADAIATFGFELERQKGTSEFASRSEFGPFESATANDRSNRAFYAQLTGSARGWLSATGGFRSEGNDRFGSFLTWRAGVNVRPDPRTVVRVAAGTAFKEPTFFENYAQGFTVGNPALEPEESLSWEFGVEHSSRGDLVALSATWFDQRFRNLIMYSGAAAPGEPNYLNVGEATARGLEVEARLGAASGPRLTASWVGLDTEVTDEGEGEDLLFQQGETLIRRPRHRFNATASTTFGDLVRAGATVVHVGSRADLDFKADLNGVRVILPAHTVVDLFAEARVRIPRASEVAIQLRAENALGSGYDEIPNFPGAKRALFLGVAWTTSF